MPDTDKNTAMNNVTGNLPGRLNANTQSVRDKDKEKTVDLQYPEMNYDAP